MKLQTVLLLLLVLSAVFVAACSAQESPAKGKTTTDTLTKSDAVVTDTIDSEIVGDNDSVEIGELI